MPLQTDALDFAIGAALELGPRRGDG